MEPLSRRLFLELAGTAGLSLLLPGLAPAASLKRGAERPRSLIVLWLAGGPSQLESWDPHPGKLGLPANFAIPTRIAGTSIARCFPRTAEQVHHLNIVRSLVSREGDHERATYFVKTGYRPDPTVKHPALASLVAHELPAKQLAIPQALSIGEAQFPARGGFLGDEHDAFRVADPEHPLQNMTSTVEPKRALRRRDFLAVVEKAFRAPRQAQADRTLHGENTRRAFEMMTTSQLDAFKVELEPAALRKSYGNTPFGQGCLLARRLIGAGVRAVEVTLDGYDSHVNNMEIQTRLAGELDPALATLIRDLRDHDLFESTIVLVIGEFGRTPQVNALEGRDHWPQGFSALIGGGGLASGRVIGATDPQGTKPDPDQPVAVNDLHATVLKVLGLNPAHELITPVGRPMKLSDGKPLAALMV